MAETPLSPSGTRNMLTHVFDELGLVAMWQSSRDVKFLCAQRFVRLFAYGGSTLVLASYLSAIGITDDRIGLFMTLTLVGDVAISFFLTLFADAMGRKAVLSLGSIMMATSGVIFALFGNYWILLAAAVFGVISPRYVCSIRSSFVMDYIFIQIEYSLTSFTVAMRSDLSCRGGIYSGSSHPQRESQ